MQQKSETTKKLIKKKVVIKNMDMSITKLRKGNKETVIMECETEEEIKKLKNTVQDIRISRLQNHRKSNLK